MSKFKRIMTALLALPLLTISAVSFMPTTNVYAANCDDASNLQDGANCGGGGGASCLFGKDKVTQKNCVFTDITNAALFIIGAISVLMLIYGGIRYTISGGDSNAVTAAKNTILYAVVGIVVAIMAYAIVNYVIGALVK